MEIDVAVKKSPLLGEGFSLGSFAVLAEAVANKAAQRNLRTVAVMTDDFGRADAADHGAGAETAFLVILAARMVSSSMSSAVRRVEAPR